VKRACQTSSYFDYTNDVLKAILEEGSIKNTPACYFLASAFTEIQKIIHPAEFEPLAETSAFFTSIRYLSKICSCVKNPNLLNI